MNNEWLNEFPANERLVFFIEGELAGDEDNKRLEALSSTLGYTNTATVKAWLAGKSKIPLRRLSTIADFFDRDIADVLPLWIKQELPDDEALNQSASRILSVYEFQLVAAAREVYLGDVED